MKAIWKDTIIAESDKTVVVEDNHYFPPDSVKEEFLEPSGNTYQCHWKGMADYLNVVVKGEVNKDAAWVYRKPTEEAKEITGYFSFWNGVEISK